MQWGVQFIGRDWFYCLTIPDSRFTLANISQCRKKVTMKVNILDAKNRLSSLIVAAERDEEVVLARNGVPVAKIIKYSAPKVAPPGAWKGLVDYSPEWDSDETNAEVSRLFNETVAE